MHNIEPFYQWLNLYDSSTDENSPFYQQEYSEFYFNNTVYNHLIHPRWDQIESETLYIKVLFADYEEQFAIIEFMGEWNDAINNDIMYLKRNVIDVLIEDGIKHFICIGENVMNFHASDDSYYEEWYEDVEEGWVVLVNFLPHVLEEMSANNIDYYMNYGGEFDDYLWRKWTPHQLFEKIELLITKRLAM